MPILDAALAKAVTIPSATIHQHVAQLRRRNPEATPAQLVKLLEKEYLLVVAGAGGAVGAAAAAPAVGTGVAVALTASDVATFFGASAAFALAVASVHGIEVEDVDRRTALLLSTILGESGASAVRDTVEFNGGSVARLLLTRMPLATVKKVNSTLTRKMVRTQVAKQTGVAIGRLIPYGIGVVVGVTGARSLGKTVIKGARASFGPAPESFPRVIEVAPTDTRTILPPPKGPSRLRSLTSRRTTTVPEQSSPPDDS